MTESQSPTTVQHWTTIEKPVSLNRHAKVLGIEFVAFPYQSYHARVGWHSASVSHDFTRGKDGEWLHFWTANIWRSDERGKSTPVNRMVLAGLGQDDARDEVFLWAAQRLLELEGGAQCR